MVMIKNGRGLLGHGTLKTAVSQEQIDELSWFFACWYKFRKAKSYFNYWMGLVKNRQDVFGQKTLKSSVPWEWFDEFSWLIEWYLHVDCDAISFGWTAIILYLWLSNVGGPLQLYLFILLIKISTLAESLICKVNHFHTFETKYLNEFKPNFVVFTVFPKKSVWDLKSA